MLDAALFAQPLVDGQRESGLAALPDGGREWRAGGGGENLFAAAFAVHQQWRETAQQMRVDQRDADFQRMRHARPIHVAQQLIAQVER